MRSEDEIDLRRALFRGGVSGSHIKRIVKELRQHREDLQAQAMSEGRSRAEALEWADQQLGDYQLIVEEALRRPELKTWSRRWPWLFFGIAPVVCYVAAALAIGCSAILIIDSGLFAEQIALRPLPTWIVVMAEAIRFLLLFALPIVFGLTWVVYGHYRAQSAAWICVACVLVALVAAGASITLDWPTEIGQSGKIGAGWGIGLERLGGFTFRALLTLIPVLASYRYFQRDVDADLLGSRG